MPTRTEQWLLDHKDYPHDYCLIWPFAPDDMGMPSPITMRKEIESCTEQVTSHLRWCKGVLQQAWSITRYRGSEPYAIETEWRDVPTQFLTDTPESEWRKQVSVKSQTMVDLDYIVLRIIDKWMDPDHIRLHAGEMTTQEMRSVFAVLRGVRAEIVRF
jgi:hypothetical protein